jgi:hypothetical protein
MRYESGTTRVHAVKEELRSMEFILKLIRENLQDAQEIMKFFANKNITERTFEVSNWVYLKLQPCRKMMVALRRNLKLSPQYNRPFQVT